MNASDRRPRRDDEPERSPQPPVATSASIDLAGRAALARTLVSLQRTAGNRAATTLARAVLSRSAVPAAPAPTHAIGRLALVADELLSRWQELGTAEQRAALLVHAAKDQLRELDVPPFKETLEAAPGAGELDANAGEFLYETWTMRVEKRRFEGPPPSYAAGRQLATIVAHETRHCQQWFAMARYLAGTDPAMDADAIVARMKIPQRIAQRAHRAPLRDGEAGFDDARVWFESVYGSGAERRREVLAKLDAAEVWYRVAKAALDRATPAERPAMQREFDAADKEYRHWYGEYANLATEADARKVGERVGVSLDRLQGGPR